MNVFDIMRVCRLVTSNLHNLPRIVPHHTALCTALNVLPHQTRPAKILRAAAAAALTMP
jgi:hypothetical protein